MGLLILMRHGKSDWSGDESDEERPLAKRGRRQTAEAGQWIAANIDHVDLAVVSPAERTRSTWDIASGEKVQEWQLPKALCTSFALTIDGRYLAEGVTTGMVTVYRVAQKRSHHGRDPSPR